MSEPGSTSRSRRRFTVESLFTDTRPQATGVTDLKDAKEIALERINADPDQPRRTFDEDRLNELAASIRAEGVLQPIVVRYDESADRYIVVHGERRWRASSRAGLTTIPALVRDVPVERRLLQQLMENVVRDDLNAVDRATALRTLRDQLGTPPWDQVADVVGIKRSRLFQLLGTGKLSNEAQESIQLGQLSEKQSRLLQGLPEHKQEALRAYLVEDQPSAQIATRVARAFRNLDIPEMATVEQVRAALQELSDLALSDDPEHQRAQSITLLDAIDLAASGAKQDRQRLKHLSSLIGTPRFDTRRFTSETGALSRSLAGLSAQSGGRSAEVDEQLRALQRAIASLLSD